MVELRYESRILELPEPFPVYEYEVLLPLASGGEGCPFRECL